MQVDSLKSLRVDTITNPTATLEAMKTKSKIFAPNTQRVSIEGTIRRMNDRGSSKVYTLKRLNNQFFSIQRTK